MAIAEAILDKGPIATRMAKRAIMLGQEVDFNTGLEIERLAYRGVVNTHDRREGLLAFQEKRKPEYKGN